MSHFVQFLVGAPIGLLIALALWGMARSMIKVASVRLFPARDPINLRGYAIVRPAKADRPERRATAASSSRTVAEIARAAVAEELAR